MGSLIGILTSSPLALILIAVMLGGIGQMLIQLGASRVGEVHSLSAFPQLVHLVLSPEVVSGLLTYAISAVLYVVVVSKRGIGYAYPFVALNQVIIVLISWVLFNQTPPAIRLAGVALICIGVVLVAKGG